MTVESTLHRDSRIAKLRTLEEKGYNPYPYRFKPDSFAADLQEKYKDLEAGTDTEDRVTVAGRAMAVRNSGMFIDIKDISGKIQAFCHKNHLSEEDLALLKSLDVGDIVTRLRLFSTGEVILPISAKSGQNIPDLEKYLLDEILRDDLPVDGVIVNNIRHYEALSSARKAILRVIEGLNSHLSGEFISQDIRECLHYLGEITGVITSDEILGFVFKNFCIGK